MQTIYDILMLVIGIARVFIFAHFIMSWLISFRVLNITNSFVMQVWYGLNKLLEPVYAPIRKVVPVMGGMDLTPLVALVGLEIIRIVLMNNVAMFS